MNTTAATFTTTNNSTITTTFTARDLQEVDESNVAPLHLHAIRIPTRLQGMSQYPPPHSPTSTSSTASSISSTIHIAPGKQTIMLPPPANTSSASSSSRRRRSRSRSRSRPSSRSTSRDPSPSSIGIHSVSSLGGIGNIGNITPGGSYGGDIGSLESPAIIVDADILLDRLGIEELECPGVVDNGNFSINSGVGTASERVGGISSGSGGHSSLPSVNERMSEESMDDCHAFTDLKNVIRQSGLGTSTNSSVMNMGLGTNNNNILGGGVEPSRSRDGSVAGGSILGDASCLLETLEEFEEEGSSDCDEKDEGKEMATKYSGIEIDKVDE